MTSKPQEEERTCTALELHYAENSGQLMNLDLARNINPVL